MVRLILFTLLCFSILLTLAWAHYAWNGWGLQLNSSDKVPLHALGAGAVMTFDLAIVTGHFKKCLLPKDDVDLVEYISAYRELNKLFVVLGGLFSFVESDVKEKEEILAKYAKQDSVHYTKVSSMLQFEIEKKTVKKTEPPSGSRTLLRLHRALAYVLRLIKDVSEAEDHAKASHIAKVAYDETLGKYHPWLVRQAVHLAIHTLPNVKQIVRDMSNGRSPADARRVMHELVVVGEKVYNNTQRMMANNKCLDLP